MYVYGRAGNIFVFEGPRRRLSYFPELTRQATEIQSNSNGSLSYLLQTAGTYCHQPEDWTAKSFSQIWRLDVQGYQEILLPGSWMIPFYLPPYMAEGRGSSWASFIRSTIPWMGSLPKTHLLKPYSEERLRWQNLEGTKEAVLLWQPWSHLAQKRSKR